MNHYRVEGFRAAAVAAGIKRDGGLDLGLIFSDADATAAGVFTTNQVKAAPVIVSSEVVGRGRARALIANSGNANACTGETGLRDARKTAAVVAAGVGIDPSHVLVASTGVIGAPLPMEKITGAVPGLLASLSEDGIPEVAEAIRTTDSFSKISLFEGSADGTSYRIVGIAKGAGMIMPDMATMLCFIMSDIAIDAGRLRKALAYAANRSFNRISVDGDMSTNDTAAVMANGLAGNGPLSDHAMEEFQEGLLRVTRELSSMIVRDGEGATKLVHVKIRGAASSGDALAAARAISNSCLVKTALYGQDPNWGRIMAALGRSGVLMKEDRVAIRIDKVPIVEGGLGKGTEYEKQAAAVMQGKEFDLIVEMGMGEYEEEIVTCDLTHDYVSINATYRT